MRNKGKSNFVATQDKTEEITNPAFFTTEKEIRTIPMSDVSSANRIVNAQISLQPLTVNAYDVQSTSGVCKEITNCTVSSQCKIKEILTECESVHLCSAKKKILEIAKTLSTEISNDIPVLQNDLTKTKLRIINKKDVDDGGRKIVLVREKEVSINLTPDDSRHLEHSQSNEAKTTTFSENIVVERSFYPEKEEDEEEEEENYEIEYTKSRVKSDVYFINRPPKSLPHIMSNIHGSRKNKKIKLGEAFKASPMRIGRKKAESVNEDVSHSSNILGRNISFDDKPSTSTEIEQGTSVSKSDNYEKIPTKVLRIDLQTKVSKEDVEKPYMSNTAETVSKSETLATSDTTSMLNEMPKSAVRVKLNIDNLSNTKEELQITTDDNSKSDEEKIDNSEDVESLSKIESPLSIKSSSNLTVKLSENFYEALATSTQITELAFSKPSVPNSLHKYSPRFQIISDVSMKDNVIEEQQSGIDTLQNFACRKKIDSPCVKAKKGAKRKVIYLYDKDARFHDDGYTIDYLQKQALGKKPE